jgi:vWA-MoxR associated protein C-terminal domain/Effector-associated domain 2
MRFAAARERLARLLSEIPTMQSHDDRDVVVTEMRRRGCELAVSGTGSAPMQCLQIIDSALGQRYGLRRLADLIDYLDKTPKAEAFVAEVDELLPTDHLLLEERFTLLADLGPHMPQPELMAYYTRAVSGSAQDEIAEPPTQFADLAELVCELEQIPAYQPGHPLVRLTQSIAERSPWKVSKVARRWSDLLARRIDEEAGGPVPGAEHRYLVDRRSRKAPEPATTGRPALVLRLAGSGPRPAESFVFTAWLYRGRRYITTLFVNDSPMGLDQVRRTLIDVMRRAFVLARQHDPNRLQIDLEFAVPREMLCYPFEEWTFTEHAWARLAKEFVVVVRDLSRQGGLVRYTGWESKWERLTQNGHVPPTGISKWITCGEDSHPSGWLYDLLRTEDGVSLGLTFPPRDSPHTIDIAEALEAGTPIAVWPRWCGDMPPGPNGTWPGDFAIQEELSRRLADRPIIELPEIVLEMRQQLASGGQPWAGLTLLWDDPWRWPEDPDFNLDVPGLAGEAM